MSLQVTVKEAKNLRAADSNGLSDPFVVLSLPGQTHKTKVVKKSLNPEFNVSFTFPLKEPHHDYKNQTLHVEVRDKDFIGSDALGQVDIPLISLPIDAAQEDEKWYTLNKTDTGEILLGLKLARPIAGVDFTPVYAAEIIEARQEEQRRKRSDAGFRS
ncbi:BAI1-associated protein 3 [Balamuthia mandrillaris]